MLRITLGPEELFNEDTQEFVKTKPLSIRLEHSLVSISKWESIWEKPFLSFDDKVGKSEEEIRSYIQCMVIGEIPDYALDILFYRYGRDIENYIESPNTATTIRKTNRKSGGKSGSVITSELIYYWMVAFNIPFETQRWHLNRLLTLIDICNIKNSDNKMPRKQAMAQQRSLNAQRRAAMKSRG